MNLPTRPTFPVSEDEVSPAELEAFCQKSFDYIRRVAPYVATSQSSHILALISKSCSYALQCNAIARDPGGRGLILYVEALSTFRLGELNRSILDLARSAELFRASEREFLLAGQENDRILSALGSINSYVRQGEISHDPRKLRLAIALDRKVKKTLSWENGTSINEKAQSACAIAVALARLGEYSGDADLPNRAIELLKPWVAEPGLNDTLSWKVKLDYVAALAIRAQQSRREVDYNSALEAVNSYVGTSDPSKSTARLHFWRATLFRQLGEISPQPIFLQRSAEVFGNLARYYDENGQEGLSASSWHGRGAALISFYRACNREMAYLNAEMALNKASSFYTIERNRADWLRVQADIAELYSIRALRNGGTELRQLALSTYARALDAVAPEISPSVFVYIAGQLFSFQCKGAEWSEAASTFEKMLSAQEFSLKDPNLGPSVYLQSLKEMRRDFASAAWCYCTLGNPGRAIEILDAFRARELALRLQSRSVGVQAGSAPRIEVHLEEVPQSLRAMFVSEQGEREVGGGGPDWTGYIATLRRTGRPPSATVRTMDQLFKGLAGVTAVVYIIFSELGSFSIVARTASRRMEVIPYSWQHHFELSGMVSRFSPDTKTSNATEASVYLALRRAIRSGKFNRRIKADGVVVCSQAYSDMNDEILKCLSLIWKLLLAPVDEALARLSVQQTDLVMVCPPGSLSRTPFLSALSVNGTVFAHKWTTTIVPSLFVGAESCTKATISDDGEPSTLIVTNPRSGPADPDHLHFAEIEARRLKRIIGSNAVHLSSSSATIENVLHYLMTAKVLHASCHGEYNPRSPGSSWIEVALDGRITIDSLRRMSGDLPRNRLCYLAACESGISELGELEDEFIGLSSGFLGAGAPAVISTLWPMFDDTAFCLSNSFYRSLFLGTGLTLVGPATALRLSSENVRKSKTAKTGVAARKSGARPVLVRSRNAGSGRWKPGSEHVVSRNLEDCPYEWAGTVLAGV